MQFFIEKLFEWDRGKFDFFCAFERKKRIFLKTWFENGRSRIKFSFIKCIINTFLIYWRDSNFHFKIIWRQFIHSTNWLSCCQLINPTSFRDQQMLITSNVIKLIRLKVSQRFLLDRIWSDHHQDPCFLDTARACSVRGRFDRSRLVDKNHSDDCCGSKFCRKKN